MVVRGPLQTLLRARAQVAAQGNLFHLCHLERGEQILQQSNTALCVQVFFFQNGENRFCSKATQHSVYSFSERREQILQQSNTTRCVQVSQNGRTDSAAMQHNTLCTGFSEWGDDILQQNNTALCVPDSAAKQHNILCTVYFTLRGEQIGVCVSLR